MALFIKIVESLSSLIGPILITMTETGKFAALKISLTASYKSSMTPAIRRTRT
jgi:hypothetical protein